MYFSFIFLHFIEYSLDIDYLDIIYNQFSTKKYNNFFFSLCFFFLLFFINFELHTICEMGCTNSTLLYNAFFCIIIIYFFSINLIFSVLQMRLRLVVRPPIVGEVVVAGFSFDFATFVAFASSLSAKNYMCDQFRFDFCFFFGLNSGKFKRSLTNRFNFVHFVWFSSCSDCCIDFLDEFSLSWYFSCF